MKKFKWVTVDMDLGNGVGGCSNGHMTYEAAKLSAASICDLCDMEGTIDELIDEGLIRIEEYNA